MDFEQRRIEITDKVLALAPYADGVVAWGDDNFPPNRGMKPPSFGKQPVVLFDCIEVNPHPKENKYSYLLNKYQLNPMQCYVLEDDEHQLALATLAGIPESNQTKITNYD